MTLTIYYDGQFWVGLVQRQTEQGLFATRHVFGPEPSDGEVFEFVNRDMDRLIESQTVAITLEQTLDLNRCINPKRLRRLVNKEKEQAGPSNVAQNALRVQLEANKKERKVLSKQEKLEEEERRWQMARDKAKKKHRGR